MISLLTDIKKLISSSEKNLGKINNELIEQRIKMINDITDIASYVKAYEDLCGVVEQFFVLIDVDLGVAENIIDKLNKFSFGPKAVPAQTEKKLRYWTEPFVMFKAIKADDRGNKDKQSQELIVLKKYN